MTIQKVCVDHLRAVYSTLPGGKLHACHAHEIVAAYFGYPTAAALQAEPTYPLSNLGNAEILIPDLNLMENRLVKLNGLPAGLPGGDDIAAVLSDFIKENGYCSGGVWQSRAFQDSINGYLQENVLTIEDDLSGVMALTNASFDELYVEDVETNVGVEVLAVTVRGSFNGENDPDRTFCGDKIAFETRMTFQRVAGRIGYREPEMETFGVLDDSDYYDD